MKRIVFGCSMPFAAAVRVEIQCSNSIVRVMGPSARDIKESAYSSTSNLRTRNEIEIQDMFVERKNPGGSERVTCSARNKPNFAEVLTFTHRALARLPGTQHKVSHRDGFPVQRRADSIRYYRYNGSPWTWRFRVCHDQYFPSSAFFALFGASALWIK